MTGVEECIQRMGIFAFDGGDGGDGGCSDDNLRRQYAHHFLFFMTRVARVCRIMPEIRDK